MTEPAPVFTDAFQLCAWILRHFNDDPRVLPRSLCQRSLRLLSMVTLALKDRDREASLIAADEILIALRPELRLAVAVDALTEEQMIHALGYVDRIGRQIGGWRKSLAEV